MLVGGSPGSTAGGMKTTTFAVLILNAAATFRSREEVSVFGRRIDNSVIKNAATIGMMYLALFLCGGFIISVQNGIPLLDSLFEAASAVGTVGLTLGVTPELLPCIQICAGYTDVSGAGRRIDTDLCSIIKKEYRKCKITFRENNSWIKWR